MRPSLPYDEQSFYKDDESDDILKTSKDYDIGYFVESNLSYPIFLKSKTKKIPFCPGNTNSLRDEFDDYMKKMKSNTYIENKKSVCKSTDEKII